MTTKDYIYTAGLFDGEGSIFLATTFKGRFRSPVCSVTNTDTNLVGYLQSTYKGHIYPKKRYDIKHTQAYVWELRGKVAIEFLELISPYLKETKKVFRANILIKNKHMFGRIGVKFNEQETKERIQLEKDFLNHE